MTTWPAYIQQLTEFCIAEHLFDDVDSALLAVSGGVDSMMLMESMVAAAPALGLSRLGAVYVDHGLRPDDTPAEAAFVKARAAHWGLASAVAYLDITVDDGSLQDAARQARRTALESLADEGSWDVIATGHHRDDQVETLLLRLLRGTSSDGLSGIAPQAGRWVHPLLPFSRELLASLALAREVPWREDPSNRSFRFLRNQIRHELLPGLESTYNPQLRTQLARLADQVRDDENYFDELLAARFCPPLIEPCADGLILQLAQWDQLPSPLRWRCLRRMIHEVQAGALPLRHIDALAAAAQSRDGEKQLSLPEGLQAIRRYDQLILTRATAARGAASPEESGPNDVEVVSFAAPGRVACWAGTLSWQPLGGDGDGANGGEAPDVLDSPWEAYLPDVEAAGDWLLRSRQPGDLLRFDFGSRPLKKWMIDAKIPKSMRYHIPLLARCDGPESGEETTQATALTSSSQIAWLIGHRRAAPLMKRRPEAGWWLRFVPKEGG